MEVPNDPPYYSAPLTYQWVVAGQRNQYSLPSIKDNEGDNYQEMIILSSAASFCTLTNRRIDMRPDITMPGGEYQVSLILKDFNPYNPKDQSYQFTIKLYKAIIANGTNDTTNETLGNNTETNLTTLDKVEEKKKVEQSTSLKAFIKEISVSGLVKVKFSASMNPIYDMSVINE